MLKPKLQMVIGGGKYLILLFRIQLINTLFLRVPEES
jgi:hypothetical protein